LHRHRNDQGKAVIVITHIDREATNQSGKTVTISWSAIGFVADSCTLVGTNGDSWVLSGSQGSVVTRPLSSSAEYTLTCTDGSGNRVSKRITVKVSPRFEEI
jgi:hypothetical protein